MKLNDWSGELKSQGGDPASGEFLSDVSQNFSLTQGGVLDFVGMSEISFPVTYQTQGQSLVFPALVKAGVSLDNAEAKGIHMSRLYKLCFEAFQENTINDIEKLRQLVLAMVESQKGLSSRAQLEITFKVPLLRSALKSQLEGYREYPVKLSLEKGVEHWKMTLKSEVLYSSTCPQSAILSRQLQAEKFLQEFSDSKSFDKQDVFQWLKSEEGVAATPHAQRSRAEFSLVWSQLPKSWCLEEWINPIEESLQTSVQTAVKRGDEQEFARLNARNLMFCEDAARRIQNTLNNLSVEGYRVKVTHMESLHAHNAVAFVEKPYR